MGWFQFIGSFIDGAINQRKLALKELRVCTEDENFIT